LDKESASSMQVNQNYSAENSVFSVHVMKEMKREKVLWQLCQAVT